MELRHLYTFQTIIKEGSFLRAAEKLQYAQSTITLHIQQLEAELGVPLFARRGKRVQLTDAGHALYEQADLLVQKAQALQQTMADIVAGEAGHIRIGAIEPTASLRLPDLIVPFCLERPKLHLTLEVGSNRSVSERVADGSIDVGICMLPEASLDLTYEQLFMEPMAILLPASHQLAHAGNIQISDLADERLILKERGCGYRQMIETAFLQHGINPYSGIEIGNLEVLKNAVQRGLGIAIMPVASVNPPPEGTTLRTLQDVKLEVPVGLVYKVGQYARGRALNAMLELMRTSLRQHEESPLIDEAVGP
ncbi:LysR family transcriptional regulator [Ktedonosporobacter rubrisoli]|uniref:LysR family transcriptional regulator n=1 Tax=Ktedonosporobacter rubrisoli TaxID=2509675 RepID=A0A4P6K348_KTERU|nr:LysR family transcriptional regulator [Ktedonosporobacter rubrisoli]QBD82667.1 LysR family transcriptional regulator [Ktedonosporobacter rubrisoli]